VPNWILFKEERWKELLTEDSYKLEYFWSKRLFLEWNCTWFVAKYKNVTWNWNAKDWYWRAVQLKIPTWKIAKKWSIVTMRWYWYNKEYWHVAIVMNVLEDKKMIIWEMNEFWLWIVSYKIVSTDSKWIIWYIYI